MGEQHRPKKWTGERTIPTVETYGGVTVAEETFAPEYAPEYEADTDGNDDELGPDIDATDAARNLAAEHGINLATITGTGADGRITKDDVEAAIVAG